MYRVLVAFAAFNTVLLLAVGVFVVHGSVRDGCAQARAAASQAWTAVAVAESGDRRLPVALAADAAAAFAAGELLVAQALAALPWAGPEAGLIEAFRAQAGGPTRIELATQASRRASAVCAD